MTKEDEKALKKKIILFHPKTLHEKNYRHFHVPYSLLSVASVIDKANYDIILIDNNVENKDDYYEELNHHREHLLCVGISAMIGHQIREGLNFARTVRKIVENIPIIWGGPLSTMLPNETIEDEHVDIIVRGQGEETFRQLVENLSDGLPFDKIKGISYKEKGRIIHNPTWELIDINNFPPYTSVYGLIDVMRYIRYDEHINTRTVSYHSSQGCPFNCGFCCETALWNNRWSGFNAQRIVDDIEFLVLNYNVNGIKFYDSEFFISQRRVFEFAEELIKRNINIKWSASAHPRNLIRLSEEQFALLKKSGARRLLIGAESGVQEELDLIGKKTNQEMILRLAELCGKHGIVASFTFVTGYPESPSSYIEATLMFAEKLRRVYQQHEIKVHFYAPYPGTPLYEYALKHGFTPPKTLFEWSWYDYYNIVTPWVDKKYEPIVREFNERHYPYLHPFAND